MAQAQLIVTGVKELDRALRQLEPKMQKKAIKKATRKAAKVVLAKTRSLTPKDTGAMAKAFGVRAVSRKIKKKTGVIKEGVNKKTGHTYTFAVKRVIGEDFGAKVEISRKSLEKASVKVGRAVTYDSDEEYFYPAFVELGGGGDSGKKPMRTALKMSEAEALAIFKQELRKMLIEERLNAAAGLPTNDSLKAEAVARGEAFYKDTSGKWQKTTGGFARLDDVRAAGML